MSAPEEKPFCLLFALQEGMQLIAEKPETEAVVKEKLTGLHQMWEELESTTQTKAQRLFDANKAELFTQSCADLDKWLNGLESQIQSDDYGKDLTSVNILLKKQQVKRAQVTEQALSIYLHSEEWEGRSFQFRKNLIVFSFFFLLHLSLRRSKNIQKQISHTFRDAISPLYFLPSIPYYLLPLVVVLQSPVPACYPDVSSAGWSLVSCSKDSEHIRGQ